MQQLIEYLSNEENRILLTAFILGILELIFRLVPTSKDLSILNLLYRILNLLPNKARKVESEVGNVYEGKHTMKTQTVFRLKDLFKKK